MNFNAGGNRFDRIFNPNLKLPQTQSQKKAGEDVKEEKPVTKNEQLTGAEKQKAQDTSNVVPRAFYADPYVMIEKPQCVYGPGPEESVKENNDEELLKEDKPQCVYGPGPEEVVFPDSDIEVVQIEKPQCVYGPGPAEPEVTIQYDTEAAMEKAENEALDAQIKFNEADNKRAEAEKALVEATPENRDAAMETYNNAVQEAESAYAVLETARNNLHTTAQSVLNYEKDNVENATEKLEEAQSNRAEAEKALAEAQLQYDITKGMQRQITRLEDGSIVYSEPPARKAAKEALQAAEKAYHDAILAEEDAQFALDEAERALETAEQKLNVIDVRNKYPHKGAVLEFTYLVNEFVETNQPPKSDDRSCWIPPAPGYFETRLNNFKSEVLDYIQNNKWLSLLGDVDTTQLSDKVAAVFDKAAEDNIYDISQIGEDIISIFSEICDPNNEGVIVEKPKTFNAQIGQKEFEIKDNKTFTQKNLNRADRS